jgi:hypothetical protein
LQANLLSVSKLVSNDFKVQSKLNECFVKGHNGKAIAIAPREGNLYGMNFTKLHGVDVTNWVQSLMGDDAQALAPPPWTFKYEGCSYTPKHGE